VVPAVCGGVVQVSGLGELSVNPSSSKVTELPFVINLALSTLIVIYAAARVLQIFPAKFPMLALVSLHVLPPLVFSFIHGALFYRIRGIVTFLALGVIVGNILENLGVRTGFPFGHYYFTELMGPKLLVVPIMLGLAYTGMAYLSWTLARLILRELRNLDGANVLFVPLLASCIMVAWDFSMDPIWATVLHGWIWLQGGVYFGVPATNFLGWYLTVYIIYQLFALYLRRTPVGPTRWPSRYWRLAVIFYGVSATGNILLTIPRAGPTVVYDPAGTAWKVSNITAASASVSIFVMGAFALLAWIRVKDRNSIIRGQGAV